MVEITFGEWLKRQRQAAGLTQKQLALQIGCAAVTLRKMEADERRPSVQIADQLAEIFMVGPNDRQKFLRFARGDWQQLIPEAPSTLPWNRPQSAPSNLPASIAALIGRQTELDLIRQYLLDGKIRLVTLIGPPGIGKTSLALESGRSSLSEFPAGVYFVALAPIDDASLIPAAITQAMGYVEGKSLSARKQLVEAIGEKQLLIVLDNCEHLIEGSASLASELLSACPRLKILATSRESLRIPGEWVFSVPALKTPKTDQPMTMDMAENFSALALFSERARAARADFVLDEANLQPVIAICDQLGGLPLAIELIAARLRLFTPQALLERLTDSYILSADGMRPASVRQKTLNNAIGWSYNLLPPQEQRFLVSLAVFSSGFTLEAAESICLALPENKTAADLITALLDKSLLQRIPDATGGQRFDMHVIIHQFALNQLRRSADEGEVRNCHLAYFLHLAEEGDSQMHGPRQIDWIDRLESEHKNIRTALEWGISNQKTEAVLRLLCALGWPWEVRGHYREALAWFDQIRALPDVEHYPLVYARLLNHIGRYCWTQEKSTEAQFYLEKSRALSFALGAQGEINLAETHNWLGLFYWATRNPDQAHSLITRGLELFEKWANPPGIALSTFHLGMVEGDLNHLDLAHSLFERSLAMFRQSGDLFFIARASINLGYLFLKQGEYDRAEALFMQHLQMDQKLRFWQGISDGWYNLAVLHRQKGEYQLASDCFEECVRNCRQHGLTVLDPYYQSGLMALQLGNFGLASQRFNELVRMEQSPAEKKNRVIYLMAMAAIAAGTRLPERAARLSGAAQAILDTMNPKPSLFEQAKFEQYIQLARDQIGEPAFLAYADEGRKMAVEQALQLAKLEMVAS